MKQKLIISIATLLIINFKLSAQIGSVSGYLKSNGKPLEFVSVALKNTNLPGRDFLSQVSHRFWY